MSLGQVPKNEIARSYGKCLFNSIRPHQTAFQSGRPILLCHQQCMRDPISLPPFLQHLYLVGSVVFLFGFALCLALCFAILKSV